ncbi:MAG TPA: cob(I)yrinic acid a,c-diamide adenosyltransferase [Dongiaceae bacterium]|nr:cob(I)yrinic acid a,c-diamide adenosyltransferase [Dongiaceae bacterium]
MGHRLSKIYTRTGDKGTTGLGDGSRVDKDSLRVEAYGTTDELNSAIGMVLSETSVPDGLRHWLLEIQHDLFDLGGELCIPGHVVLDTTFIERLEQQIDEMNEALPPLKEFILPGGNRAASTCHLARTICRRAERRVLTLAKQEPINDWGLKYLNRLSDFLFVAARVLARTDNGAEVLWNRQRFTQP